jgi:hypothetical protein
LPPHRPETHPCSIRRAALAVAALEHLGVPDALELVAFALDEDPIAGAERVLLCVLRFADQTQAQHRAAIDDACALISAMSERIDLLTDALREVHREQERANVLPLRHVRV